VLASAVRYGAGPSVFAALLSVLCYNFFFIPPLYTFTIADPANVVALFFFMIVALLTSSLTARTRTQALIAKKQARTTGELYSFSKKLAGIAKLDDLLWATAHQIASMLKVEVVLLTPDDGAIAVRAGFPPEDQLDDADLAAAKWCWDHNQPAGRGADTLPGAKRLFLPLRTGRGAVGVLGINRKTPGPLFTPDERRLLDALSDQAAVAIERTRLAEDIDEARVLAETERLRSLCSPRSRTICARRWPPSSAPSPACAASASSTTTGRGTRCWRPRRTRASVSTASWRTCWT